MKFYFPVHINGGNRGCEGIAKGTAVILDEPKEKLIGLCTDIPTDRKLGLDKYITLQPPYNRTLLFRIVNKFYVLINQLFHRDSYNQSKYSYQHFYGRFIHQMSSDDVLISTGGDMMCYNDNYSIYTALEAKKLGCKTILWGCSIGPKDITDRKKEALRSFDFVYARESLSYEFLKSLGLNNVACFPDPAFSLDPIPIPLPDCFNNRKVIGINLSNLTVGATHLDTPFGQEVKHLLDYILLRTNYYILLIPHVTWSGQDDRLLANNTIKAYQAFENKRMEVLNIDMLNYLQIRFIISNCHLFIGGRTHAVISAYSTGIPTIALGYSIKSKGISHDLGLPEELVIDTKKSSYEGELINAFLFGVQHHDEINSHLKRIMPSYCARIKQIKRELPWAK